MWRTDRAPNHDLPESVTQLSITGWRKESGLCCSVSERQMPTASLEWPPWSFTETASTNDDEKLVVSGLSNALTQ